MPQQESCKPGNFAVNLKLLCSYYRSISDVSRKLNLNRSQFNKYLTGTTRPSMHTLRKIESFFGVEEHELFMPPRQFTQILDLKPARAAHRSDNAYETHVQNLQNLSKNGIQKYQGVYFEYYMSMTYPGHILRTLVQLTCSDSGAYYKRIERISPSHRGEKRFRCIYLGSALYLADRIYMIDYESLTNGEISQSIFFPSYKSRSTFLTGIKLGVSCDNRHSPSATRTVLEYLGDDVKLRQAIRMCGLFDSTSDEIGDEIKKQITNSIDEDEVHLVPARLDG